MTLRLTLALPLRRIIAIALITILSAIALAANESDSRLSIPFVPPTLPAADIVAMDPAATNLNTMPSDTAYAGKIYQYLSDKPETKPAERFARYSLHPTQSGSYALFAAINVQGQSWSSPVRFRINKQPWQNAGAPAAGTPNWGVSNALAWTSLGVFDLTSTEDSILEFSSDKPRSLDGRMAVYLNGVVGYKLDAPRPIHIQNLRADKKDIAAGQALGVTIEGSDPSTFNGLVVEALYHNSRVAQSVVHAAANDASAQVSLQIPFDVPAGEYKVAVQPLFFQRITGNAELTVNVQPARKAPVTASTPSIAIADASFTSEGNLGVRLAEPAPASAFLGVWYIDQRGYLMAAASQALSKGVRDATIALQDERWRQRNVGTLQVFVHGSALPATIVQSSVASHVATIPAKPMSYGVYKGEQGNLHRWYVTDDHTLIWDGQPWIPFGGMYCDPVLAFFTGDAKARAERWTERDKVLGSIQQAGISDMYLNLAHGPLWARQEMVNELTRRQIRFGWQLDDKRIPFEAYPIRASVKQGLCIGEVREPGKLEVELPREAITGLLAVTMDDTSEVKTLNINLNFDQKSGFDFILMDLKTDQKKGFVRVRVDFPNLATGRYYILPRIKHSGHMMNVWHEDQVLAAHEWIKEIQWGPNLRFFIDPTNNEGGIYNDDESLRVWSDAFNQEFALWLNNRYHSTSELEKAWKLTSGGIKSFEQAARLLPIRERSQMPASMMWIDPVALKILSTSGGLGDGWNDYADAVRETYALHRDHISRQLRQWVDVPIVFKRVTPWVCDENINREVGGMNGIGIDIYSDKGSKISTGLSSGSLEAQLGAQTIWIMGAELGYNANPDNGKVRGFPSATYVRDLTRTTAAWGMKGFMYFGLRLEPYTLWGAMQLHSVPEQLQWIQEARQDVTAHWPAPMTFAQCYPQGENWWWRSGGELLNRYSCVYDSGPGAFRQSTLLAASADESQSFVAVNGSQRMQQAGVLLVNFRDAEAVSRFGRYVQEWIQTGRPVAYLGEWPAGAVLPGLAEHFSQDGKSLQHQAGDEVLAESAGRVIAKRHGKLLLVAGDLRLPGPNSKVALEMLKPEWLKLIMTQN